VLLSPTQAEEVAEDPKTCLTLPDLVVEPEVNNLASTPCLSTVALNKCSRWVQVANKRTIDVLWLPVNSLCKVEWVRVALNNSRCNADNLKDRFQVVVDPCPEAVAPMELSPQELAQAHNHNNVELFPVSISTAACATRVFPKVARWDKAPLSRIFPCPVSASLWMTKH